MFHLEFFSRDLIDKARGKTDKNLIKTYETLFKRNNVLRGIVDVTPPPSPITGYRTTVALTNIHKNVKGIFTPPIAHATESLKKVFSIFRETGESIQSRYTKIGADPALLKAAVEAGFLEDDVVLGARGRVYSTETLTILKRVASTLAKDHPDLKKKELIAKIVEYTGIGRDTVWLALTVDAFRLEGGEDRRFVPSARAYQKRGFNAQEAKTKSFTRGHLLVLVLYVNMNFQYKTLQGRPDLALVMRSLPAVGEPITILETYLRSRGCSRTMQYAEMRQVAASSPGPVVHCTVKMVRAAMDKINESPTIPHELLYGKVSAVPSEGTLIQNVLEKQFELNTFLVAMEVNNHRPLWKAYKAKPQPTFKCTPGYRHPPFADIQYQLVWTDETIVNKNTAREMGFHDSKGAGGSGSSGPGERVAIVLFLDRDGINGWSDEDYSKLQDLYFYPLASPTKGPAKAWSDALKFMCKEFVLPQNSTSWLPPFNPPGFTPPNASSFGRYGIYAWEVKKGDDATHFSNMDNDLYVPILTKQALSWTRPTWCIMDQSTVHGTIEGFNPFRSDVTKVEAETFLRDKHASEPLGEYGLLYSGLFDTTKVPHTLKVKILAPELIAKIKGIMKTRPLSRVELALAEIGMRRFGVPHRVILIPVRMPDFDPCEFVFGVTKDDYKRRRFARFDAKGDLAGPQGMLEFRANVCRMFANIDQGQMRRCARHSEDIMRWHFTPPLGETPESKTLNEALETGLLEAGVKTRLGGVVYSRGPALVEPRTGEDEDEDSDEENEIMRTLAAHTVFQIPGDGAAEGDSDEESGDDGDDVADEGDEEEEEGPVPAIPPLPVPPTTASSVSVMLPPLSSSHAVGQKSPVSTRRAQTRPPAPGGKRSLEAMKDTNPSFTRVTPDANRQKPSATPSSTSDSTRGRVIATSSSSAGVGGMVGGGLHPVYGLRNRATLTGNNRTSKL